MTAFDSFTKNEIHIRLISKYESIDKQLYMCSLSFNSLNDNFTDLGFLIDDLSIIINNKIEHNEIQ